MTVGAQQQASESSGEHNGITTGVTAEPCSSTYCASLPGGVHFLLAPQHTVKELVMGQQYAMKKDIIYFMENFRQHQLTTHGGHGSIKPTEQEY
jgi:hypothetical protein